MALSKVLQKMAEKHQTSESSSLQAPDQQEQTTGAAGILLSLLTERQQKLPTTTTPPPSTSPPGDRKCDVGESTASTHEEESSNSKSDKVCKDSRGKEAGGGGKSAASVLMQLLQKTKSVGEEVQEIEERTEDVPNDDRHVDVVGDSNSEGQASPIVIEPLATATGNNHHNSVKSGNNESKERETVSREGTPLPSLTAPPPAKKAFLSTLCKICNRGFWDREKFLAHMKEEHDTVDGLTEAEGGSSESSSHRVETEKPSSITPDNSSSDNSGLRRSKRKRKPARRKYQYDEEEHSPELATLPSEIQPKILRVEGNVSMDSDSEKSNLNKRLLSTRDTDKTATPLSLRQLAPGKNMVEEVEGSLASDSEESNITVEQVTSYRCSKCFLYFNSHEETRKHLRQEHNVLTASIPPSSCPSPAATDHHHPSCSSCGCDGHRNQASTPRHITCLICGQTARSGMKNFVNIFKGRTWSARYHQLAKRLSKAFGCKFSKETCRSKHACVTCVNNLETIEKAKLLRVNMANALKRTKLVSSAGDVAVHDSGMDYGGDGGDKHAAQFSPSTAAASASRGTHIPAAPLVRELLSAPEVVLPRSQFTELIDAIGNDEDQLEFAAAHTTASNTGLPREVVLSPKPQDSLSQSSRSGGIGRRKGGKRVTASQHDDAAFSDFVSQLQSRNNKQPSEATSSTNTDSQLGEAVSGQIGRLLAVVKVKEEPTSEEERNMEILQQQPTTQKKRKSDSEIYKKLTSNNSGSSVAIVHQYPQVDEYRNTYTKLQIDSQSGQTEYNCVLCNNSFYSEEAIQIHVKCHIPGTKELHCFLCGFHNSLLPSQWRIMKRHLETEHNFPDNYFHRFPCPVKGCADVFKCQKELVNHVSKVHRSHIKYAQHAQAHALAELGLFDFPCHMCGTLLQSEAALEIHILCHNGSHKYYQCCYCNYMHNSQPGSWRIMRGHLTKEHVGKELASDTFSYYECPYYACRLKFCSKKAQIVHRACHDETKDGEFFCFHCHFSVPATPYLWEKVKEHIIARHPEMVGESFRCTCKSHFSNYIEFFSHLMQSGREGSS